MVNKMIARMRLQRAQFVCNSLFKPLLGFWFTLSTYGRDVFALHGLFFVDEYDTVYR